MAKKRKDTFVFRVAWQEVLLGYPPEVRLEVYDAIVQYVASGTPPQLKPLASMAFSFIRRDIDADNRRYEDVVSKKREAGRKGMASRWKKDTEEDNKDNTCYHPLSDVTEVTPITDNDNVYDSVEKEISLSKEKETKKETKVSLPAAYTELSLEECHAEIMRDEIWAQDILISAHRKGYTLDQQKLAEYVTEFFGELKCRGDTSRSLKGAKEHFSNWLNVKIEKQKQYEQRNSNGRGNYTSKQEANEYAINRFLAMRESRGKNMETEVAKPF